MEAGVGGGSLISPESATFQALEQDQTIFPLVIKLVSLKSASFKALEHDVTSDIFRFIIAAFYPDETPGTLVFVFILISTEYPTFQL